MKISQLAKLSKLSTHTLRYYEKAGLITPTGRSKSNYRIYSKDDLITLEFIKRSKRCGFSLSEIRSLLTIKNNKELHICAEAKLIASDKIADITQQIMQLQQMQQSLTQLVDYCSGGQESAKFCSIISSLEREV